LGVQYYALGRGRNIGFTCTAREAVNEYAAEHTASPSAEQGQIIALAGEVTD
jgi:hypothetical protein